ncbi:zinc finger protein SHOOT GRAVITROPISM 5-like [Lycium ferocissimum]|uniref:zinc finger protein SHOOT GRAVITROPISM 5-like n=1 Tax=Lycium ferocissimum TaxID=112874 RepID=UPI0028161277|nr:zinc finger protein SHOOT GRAVITROPISM 5-like [Lycium ferocissimum]
MFNSSTDPFTSSENGNNCNNKRKRRPAGTPDPDAEVVSLSPKTLLESDRYMCEICNQGFQRDQNLQMHRRRHKVPWKLLKRETPIVKKRVFVCPEPTCLHHDPCHALGDLVGIKKHFRRKHSNHKQWVCEKCNKGYAVQSDYKAHLKTCGTRGHSCDCGRVFSRVESFIEHQDACSFGKLRSESQSLQLPTPCLSRTASSPSPSSDHTNNLISTNVPWPTFLMATPNAIIKKHNLELQLLTTNPTTTSSSSPIDISVSSKSREYHSTHNLQLSIGSSDLSEKNDSENNDTHRSRNGLDEFSRERLRQAMGEKAYAEEARKAAKREIELAEQELANAKRIRRQAQVELEKAQALKEEAIRQINFTLSQITCHACKQQFQARRILTTSTSIVPTYQVERNDDQSIHLKYATCQTSLL